MQVPIAMTNVLNGVSERAYRYAHILGCVRAVKAGVGTLAIATVLLALRNLVLKRGGGVDRASSTR